MNFKKAIDDILLSTKKSKPKVIDVVEYADDDFIHDDNSQGIQTFQLEKLNDRPEHKQGQFSQIDDRLYKIKPISDFSADRYSHLELIQELKPRQIERPYDSVSDEIDTYYKNLKSAYWHCYYCKKYFTDHNDTLECVKKLHNVKGFNLQTHKPLSAEPDEPIDDVDVIDVFEEPKSRSYQEYIDKIRSGEWHKYPFPYQTRLPGMGTSKKSCGHWITRGCVGYKGNYNTLDTIIQNEKHKKHGAGLIQKHILSCNMLSCPTCFEAAISHRASRATERLAAFYMILDSDIYHEHSKKIFNHFVVAVNPDEYELMKSADYRKKFENKLTRQLKKIGVYGGLRIFHGFSFSKNLGKPVWRPHYHFVLAGYTESDDIKKLYAKYGNVYHSIRTFTEKHDLYGVIRYLLTHATITEGHTIRYIGLAQNRLFSVRNIRANSSELTDTVDVFTRQLESGEKLPVRYQNVKLSSAIIQRFRHGSAYDLADYTKTEPHTMSLEQYSHAITQKDNAPISKSASFFGKIGPQYADDISADGTVQELASELTDQSDHVYDVLRLQYSADVEKHDKYNPSLSYIEKCDIVKFVIIYYDPSTDNFCPVCRRLFRHIVPIEPDQIPIFDPEQEYTPVNTELYEYFSYLIHAKHGLPYYTDQPTFKLDTGERELNPFYELQTSWIQNHQWDELEKGMKSVLRYDFLKDADENPEKYGECKQYVSDMIEQWRTTVRGVPAGTTGTLARMDRTEASIKAGKQKVL